MDVFLRPLAVLYRLFLNYRGLTFIAIAIRTKQIKN